MSIIYYLIKSGFLNYKDSAVENVEYHTMWLYRPLDFCLHSLLYDWI